MTGEEEAELRLRRAAPRGVRRGGTGSALGAPRPRAARWGRCGTAPPLAALKVSMKSL